MWRRDASVVPSHSQSSLGIVTDHLNDSIQFITSVFGGITNQI